MRNPRIILLLILGLSQSALAAGGSSDPPVYLPGTFYRDSASGGGAVPFNRSLPGDLAFSPITSLTLNADQAAILLAQTL